MTVEEMQEMRKALELNIYHMLSDFSNKTGLTPYQLDVRTVDVTQIGPDSPRSSVVVGVLVGAEL